MSTFAARLYSCAAVLLLTFGVGCKDRPEEEVPRTPMAVQAPEAADCAPEGVRPSELVYVGAARATYGEPVTVAARLTDAAGRPLVGREVLLRLGEQSQQVVTDAVGLARTQLVPPGPAGTLEVSAHFAGDAEYAASSVTAPFQLERAPTLLTLVGPTLLASDVAQPLVARLVRLDDSQPVTGRGITFTAGTFSAGAVTDAAGEARVSLPPGVATGTLRVNARFAGDGFFAPSQDSGDVLRYLPTAFSIWGGNTPGLKLGDRVNFWGHSWAKQVLGGDYDAQSDHKGWAPGLAVYGLCQPDARIGGATPALTPGCWSSKTGNSFPPATLPEYIGVIVTTAVAKTQGEVYGNVAAVAVVKVDPKPAYGPVPGKPGFGTLVAVVAAGGSTGLPVPAQPSATQRQPTLVSPGEGYSVTLDVGNASATAALDVVATEHFSGGSTPTEATQALGMLAGNATVSHAFAQQAPALAPRGASEPEANYLARLAALDGQPLVASGTVRYVDPTGAPTRPLNARSWSRVRVPRLVLGLSAANCAQPCGVITYTVQVTNLGLGKTASTTATLRLPDGTERTLELGVLQLGESRSAQVDWAMPPIAPRGENETLEEYLERLRAADGSAHPAHATLTWTDAVGGTYGPLTREVGTTMRLPVLTVMADGPLSVLPGETFTASFRVVNMGTAEVHDARLVVEGAAPIAPMNLAPGATVSVPVTLSAPGVAPRAGGESEVDYLARLRASDRMVLAFPFSLDWPGACSTHFGPLTGSLKAIRVLPVVAITLEGTAEAETGDTLHYVARLENVGSAEARGLDLTALLPDGSERQVAMTAGVLARGGAISVPFDFTLPSTTPAGTVTTMARVIWQDGRASAYGPSSARAETRVRQTNTPPVVDAGPDLTVTHPEVASLLGSATDDGRPAPLSTSWVQLSGPAPALIVDSTSLATAVRFTVPGDYTFRLVGTDSEFTAQDEMVVHVRPREGSGTTLPGGEPTPGEEVINVVREGNALRLDDTTRPFNFIWVAVSTKGTVVKIDTTTGNVLGEYWTAPANESKDPSRTTVDKNGNVWATNRANNSLVHIGLVENGQCQDRNGNGRIDTSTGYGDVRAWGSASSTANNAAITTAADECILHYVKVRSSGTRHVSINEDNDVWVSGTGGRYFDLIDGRTGVIKREEPSVGYGGYGGLIDRNGVIWSTAPLMRWDTTKPLTGASGVNWKALPYASYGVCLAPDNNVWVTEYGAYVRKFAPDGTLLGTYYHGSGGAQGCVVAPDGDVWVAHSTGSSSVGHLKSDGRLVGTVPVGSGPTGVAVDGSGKVWATNYNSRTVSRIDPSKGTEWSGDGSTHVGQVDFTTRDLGGNLYNYSDMTGSTLSGAPESGTWSYVYDSGKVGSTWGKVAWLAEACGDATLKVSVQSSASATSGFSPPVVVRSGVDFDVPAGRYLKVTVNFRRSTRGESPVLYNLTLATDDYVLEAPGVNGPPHVSAGRNRTVTLPNVGRVTGSACDDALPAGGPLTLAWTQVSGPGMATFANPGQEATDVTFSAPGAYVLRLTASDGSLSGSAEATVTVEPLNLPPVVGASGPAALTLPDMALLSATLSDDGLPVGSGLTGSWSKVSGPGTVTFTDGSALVTQASFGAPGAYVLRFTGFDGHLERTADVAVQVHAPPPVNAAPVVSAGPNVSVALGAQAQLNGSMTDDGLPTASVTASWTRVSGPGTVTFTAPSSATTRASFSAAGTYVLRLTASDGALSASADVVVGVNTPAPTNAPPRVSAGPNRAVVLSGAATLDGNVTDDGQPGGPLAITWAHQSGPGTVTFANTSAPATTATFSAAGTYVLRLSANDGQFIAWSEMSVVVSSTTPSNQAPVVTVSPSRSITLPTRTASVSGDAADDGLPTGSTLTYQWSVVSGPAGLVFTAPTQKTTTVSVTAPGAYRLRLTASDSRLTGSADTVLTVNAEADANQPPSIDPGPNLSVMQPADAVPLAGTATDDGRPAGSTLSVAWRKLSGPGTVTFADASSAATTAAFSTSGDYVLELSASDGEWRASGPKNVRVTPYVENKAPVVAASAPSQATLPDPVLLSGSVRDDGLPVTGALTLSWTKLSGPGTVTFTRPNQASTYVSFSGPGDYVLRFSAHDGDKGASADVSVRAVQTNRAPSVSAGPSQSLVHPERVALLSGSVADDGLPEGSTLSLEWTVVGGPGAVTFTDPGAAVTHATFSYPGSYLLRLTASDGERSASSDTVVDVGAPVGGLPQVALTSPTDGATLKGVTPITGTISGGIWRVEACLGAPGTTPSSECILLGAGEGSVVNGTLATFDPSTLLNGTYTVQVVATTSSGTHTATATAVVEGNLKVGPFSVSFTDLQVPVMGLPIELTRTYDSRDTRVGDFGHGWSMDVRNVRVEKSGKLGRGWEQYRTSGLFPNWCLRAVRPSFVTVTFPGGKVYRFRATTSPGCQFVIPLQTVDLGFEPEPGTHGELVAYGTDALYVQPDGGGLPGPVLLTSFDLEPLNPTHFRLTVEDGTVYELDEELGVRSVRDRNGNSLVFTANSIVHSSGKSVTFTRDARGRITRITDPNGASLAYAYDARGDLASITDREGNITRFTYDTAHHLLSITDPLGRQPIRNEYDAAGRLVRTTDAAGRSTSFEHRTGTREQVLVDRLGNTTVYAYDADGNVVRETYADGTSIARSFDARGNVLSVTDALGRTTRFTYDALDNVASQTDALGNVTRTAYDSRRNPVVLEDSLGRVITQAYDSNGNLTQMKDALGQTMRLSYTRDGALVGRTDAAGCSTTLSYDAEGRLLSESDALGLIARNTYDANGNLTSTTQRRATEDGEESLVTRHTYTASGRRLTTTRADGSVLGIAYDNAGREVSRTDALGNVTRTENDALGRPVRTVYPDGTSEAREYDAEGRVVAQTDRAGRTTRFELDVHGRVVATTHPDGAVTRNTYDAAGQLVATTDARGNTTRYGYDAAGRRTRVVDALGGVTLLAYDTVGNLTQETDPAGHVTRYEYDALNRRVRTVFANGTETRTGYDAAGRVAAEVDQAGQTTRFAYDCRGRLQTVTDALGGVTRYTYDALGSRTSMTDAEGRVTRYAYDAVGREISRALPDGASDLRVYDGMGNVVSRTSFAGVTTAYTYDADGRLLTRRSGTGPTYRITYAAGGRRASVSDPRGTTRYTYDAAGRLTRVTQPDGTSLAYAYDADGNRTELTARLGAVEHTARFGYDAASRLNRVVDAAGRAYQLTYDASGNRIRVAYPNGVETSYTYDALNRLAVLATRRTADGVTLQSYAYTLDPTGARTRIDEAGGATRSFTYDALYRVTGETVAGVAHSYTQGFSYDRVGNRTAVTRTDATGTTVRAAAFDARDRLLTAGDTDYGWDADGQLVSRTGADAATFTWGDEERLQRVMHADGRITEHLYDVDGNRVETRETPAGGGAVRVTRFLVDASGRLSHVVAELDGAGALRALYTRANDELLSVARPGGSRFFHADGLGSVRRLSDEAGGITDSYAYSAFGELESHDGTNANAFRYAGEALDLNTGFYFNRARWLDPRTGRFASVDPLAPPSHDPLELHRYVYARNEVVNRVDPTGLTSLASVCLSISIQVTMFTVRHGTLMGAIGFVINVLLPEEVHNSMMASGLPGMTQMGAMGQGGGRVLRLIKSEFFRNLVKRGSRSDAGRLWNAVGHSLEELCAKYLFPGAQREVAMGGHVADFVWRGFVIEVKSATHIAGRELRQLRAFADEAAATGRQLVYVFLDEPDAATVRKIQQAGGMVTVLY